MNNLIAKLTLSASLAASLQLPVVAQQGSSTRDSSQGMPTASEQIAGSEASGNKGKLTSPKSLGQASDFFPFKNGAKWDYVDYEGEASRKTHVKTTNINGMSCYGVAGDFGVTFFAKTKDGIAEVATLDKGKKNPTAYVSPIIVIPSSLEVGHRWSKDADSYEIVANKIIGGRHFVAVERTRDQGFGTSGDLKVYEKGIGLVFYELRMLNGMRGHRTISKYNGRKHPFSESLLGAMGL